MEYVIGIGLVFFIWFVYKMGQASTTKGSAESVVKVKLIPGQTDAAQEPYKDQWPRIINALSDNFQKLRVEWFNSHIPFAREHSFPVKHETLGGDAELAIKAWQLYWTSYYLNGHGYISQNEGKDFADVLWAQVAGSQNVFDVMPYVNRYAEKGDDMATSIHRFSRDIAAYITGGDELIADFVEENTHNATKEQLDLVKQTMVLSVGVGHFVPHLTAFIHASVANAFDDVKTYEEIMAKQKVLDAEYGAEEKT